MATSKTDKKVAKRFVESEGKLVHLMVQFRTAVEDVLDSGISAGFFDERFRTIVKAIFEVYTANDKRELLTQETFLKILKQKQRSEEIDGAEYMWGIDVYSQCRLKYRASLDDLTQLKKDLIESYTGRCFADCLDVANQEIDKYGYFFAARNFIDRLQSKIGLAESNVQNFVDLAAAKSDFVKHIKEQQENPHAIIKCGIPEIDQVVGVGFRPQHLTLFVGDVGSHKTNTMLNVALEVYKRGHSVLFISLEMPWEDLTKRIVARETVGLTLGQLADPQTKEKSPDLVPMVEGSGTWTTHDNKFCILSAAERMTVSAVRREIEKRAHIFQPELVIIDYIAIMKPDMRRADRHDIEIGEILKDLRFLGKKYNFHVISAAQMGRATIRALKEKSDPEEIVDTTAVRGSHDYSADADTIFALLRTPEPERIRILTIKARHSLPKNGDLQVNGSKCLVASTEGEHNQITDPEEIGEVLCPEPFDDDIDLTFDDLGMDNLENEI